MLAAAVLAGGTCLDRPVGPGQVESAPASPDRNLFVYTIDDTGGLTPVPGSPFPSGGKIDDVESLSASGDLGLIFLAHSVTHTFAVLRQDTATGALTPVRGSPFWAEGINPSETGVNPAGTLDGRYVFIGNASSNDVSMMRLRGDGVPLRLPRSPSPTFGRLIEGMTIHPNGRWLFINNAGSGTVSVLEAGRAGGGEGALLPVGGSPFPGVFLPDEVVVHPSGNFIFVTNRSEATISVFSVGPDGALAPVPGSPFAAPPGYRAHEHGVLNSTGTLLFVGSEIPPAVAVYQVGPGGSLTLVPGTPILLGTPGPGGPEGMVVDPTDRLLFVTDHVADRIHVFAIELDGTLRAVVPGGVAVPAEPLDALIPEWRVAGRPALIVATKLR